MYLTLKHLHVTTVALSFFLFFLRGVWMLADSPRLAARWVKFVPHINDTVLLMSAITLTVIIGQYPFVHDWLTAKVLGLLAYIGLGMVALKRGRTKRVRLAAWLGALLVFGYIVAVARTKTPLPFPG